MRSPAEGTAEQAQRRSCPFMLPLPWTPFLPWSVPAEEPLPFTLPLPPGPVPSPLPWPGLPLEGGKLGGPMRGGGPGLAEEPLPFPGPGGSCGMVGGLPE